MVTLKDYLATLVEATSHSRVSADLETAKIAEIYAEHELLKHFSVPRMKLRDVEITIPIAIDELEESEKKDYQPIKNTDFQSRTYEEIKNAFKVSKFSRATSTPLRKILFTQIDLLEKNIKGGEPIAASLRKFSDAVADASIDLIGKAKGGGKLIETVVKTKKAKSSEEIKQQLVANLSKNLLRQIKPREFSGKIENARITVEADKLKEKRPESLVYIKMKITEEGMEWHTMQDEDGNTVSKLMPE